MLLMNVLAYKIEYYKCIMYMNIYTYIYISPIDDQQIYDNKKEIHKGIKQNFSTTLLYVYNSNMYGKNFKGEKLLYM